MDAELAECGILQEKEIYRGSFGSKNERTTSKISVSEFSNIYWASKNLFFVIHVCERVGASTRHSLQLNHKNGRFRFVKKI